MRYDRTSWATCAWTGTALAKASAASAREAGDLKQNMEHSVIA
ncbi:Uncharacterised protein [Achromobacter xylosoxidans]|nr:Uncharacterised protein [Achromobacter xylosoxidans]